MAQTPKIGKLTTTRKHTPVRKQTADKPEISDIIGQRLRSYYDDAAKLPIPDRFLDLLKKLEDSSPDKDKK